MVIHIDISFLQFPLVGTLVDGDCVVCVTTIHCTYCMCCIRCRGEGGTKKELIDTARAIAEHSAVVTRLAKGLAAECTDKRMRTVSRVEFLL